MKIVVLAIGKTNERYLIDAISDYQKRLSHYLPFELEILPEPKNTKNLSFNQQKEKSSEQILKFVQESDFLVLLDDKGKTHTSLEFSAYMERKMTAGNKRLIFVIGGPYGFSTSLYKRANEKFSLSKMTFSHQMVRLIFLEQLYRAMTILKGEPYHHE